MLYKSINAVVIFSLVALISYFAITNWFNLSPQETPSPQPKITTLTLKGSNTVGESFAPLLVKAFLRQQGATLIQEIPQSNPVEKIIEGKNFAANEILRIEIKAHGSSFGFSALEQQTTDIAMSSRAIKSSEQATLTKQFGDVVEHPIALDALAIITHPENSLDALSIKQIAQIFSGEVTNWQQLGGANQAISIFSRDDNSGTWDTFKNLVLKPHQQNLLATASRHESSKQLVDKVTSTQGAIGFVGVAYVEAAKLLRVTSSTNEFGALPNGYTIGTQAYPLSRKLYLYVAGDKRPTIAKEFIQFVAMNDGQKLANEVGLVSYYPTHYRPKNVKRNSSNTYQTLLSIGKRITVDFSGDVSKVDQAKELRDLQRLRNFVAQNPGRKLVLVDFSNSTRLANLKQTLQQNELAVLDTLSLENSARNESDIEVWVL